MNKKAFEWLWTRILQHECCPSEGNKKKSDGCFNAVNDYGKEPTEQACRKCWMDWLTKG